MSVNDEHRTRQPGATVADVVCLLDLLLIAGRRSLKAPTPMAGAPAP